MNIKQIITVGFAGMAMWVGAGVVSNVNVSNRYPWNGMVDVKFNLSQDAAVTLTALDKVGGTNLTMKALLEAGVPMQNGLTCLSAGDRHVVWNAATDYPNSVFENVEISVTADEQLYMVINLTKVGDTYPVSYLAGAPKSGWSVEYKTKYLVLRKIKAGTFMMGSPEGEWGRGSNETQSEQTIDKDYYIGVFEVTLGQLFKVTGNLVANDSSVSAEYFYKNSWSPQYPVPLKVVGSGWNSTTYFKPYADSDFVSALTSGTGLNVTLPTEAQWEYACRAGTQASVYTGESPSSKAGLLMSLYGYENTGFVGYLATSSADKKGVMAVGSFLPNPWGLYDMCGNVSEKTEGLIIRGADCWCEDPAAYRSARRGDEIPKPSLSGAVAGFRVVAIP